MESHLYLSVMPEALIASHLTPEQFGAYYATGSQKKSRSMAMFFELDPDYRHEYFDMEAGLARLVPHEDGAPKRSAYISVYRVVEHVAPSAVKRLYLTTQDGRTLGIDAAEDIPECIGGMHLYQEIAPVHPRVVSSLCPADFYDYLYDPAQSLVTVPALCFVELTLGGLALMGALLTLRIPGALLLGILAITAVAWSTGLAPLPTAIFSLGGTAPSLPRTIEGTM